MRPSLRLPWARSLRALRALTLLLRVLVLLVAVELSGVAAVAELGVCGDETSSDCCTDCPVEKDGKECPPGCPNCHCSHGGIALPPAFETVSAEVATIDVAILRRPYEAGIPHAPHLPGVYRPPRLLRPSHGPGLRNA